MDIYNNKSKFKVGIVAIALLLAGVSLYYTNTLVKKLEQREKRLIDLYAKGLEFAVDEKVGDELTFLMQEIVGANNSVPMILTDEKGKIINSRNIKLPSEQNGSIEEPQKLLSVGEAQKIVEQEEKILQKELAIMREENLPIVVSFLGEKNYIYYRNSDLLEQLRYYPYVQFVVIVIFGLLTYMAFNYSRRAEQNRIWVGLAKETAHQLGTPISSLMAWVEYLRLDDTADPIVADELEKDVQRLQMVTARFSSIGSEPTLQPENISAVVQGFMNYLQRRISSQVKVRVKDWLPPEKMVNMNRYLFEWVIENICKNAVDAMAGRGELRLRLREIPEGDVVIDITDTGKGMNKQQVKQVFNPGFTTKKRGWGLGLTLAKRIIEEYHKGRIFIKTSEVDKGTTFSIILKEGIPEEA
ncbi:ATP-binding protein [uncultured Microscilla sp.]|uniref:sensor histidine kinase n=1 Tax=uncultured Microscilla sp. TaxID=432653 RepID=UPI002625205B|nr:ATP-binding protein [uncultured Microscilla sp.]